MLPAFPRTALALAVGVALVSCTANTPEDGTPPDSTPWSRQFGTSSPDYVWGIAVDADGNTFVTGGTSGALEGSNAGGNDAYVRSYDADGDLRWTRQFGSAADDYASDVASDGDGNVYVAGSTLGALEGANAGGIDAYVRSVDANGTHRWTNQFDLAGEDQALGITTDANGVVYVTGYVGGLGDNAGSADGFVVSYDSAGSHRWTDIFGSTGTDVGLGIAVDVDGNTFVTGRTEGAIEGANMGGNDAYVRSYDASGALRWTRQFGTTSDEFGYAVAVDADGNCYVAGFTEGALEGVSTGDLDAYVRSYDAHGTLRWTRQFGTTSADGAFDIAVDGGGNGYVTGFTRGALEGASAGGNDAYVRSFDPSGTLRWTLQFGTDATDRGTGVATDVHGEVYAAGNTFGALEGPNAGSFDGYVRTVAPQD